MWAMGVRVCLFVCLRGAFGCWYVFDVRAMFVTVQYVYLAAPAGDMCVG